MISFSIPAFGIQYDPATAFIHIIVSCIIYRYDGISARSNLVSPETSTALRKLISLMYVRKIPNLRTRVNLNHMQSARTTSFHHHCRKTPKSLEQTTASDPMPASSSTLHEQRFLQNYRLPHTFPIPPGPIVAPVILISALLPGPVGTEGEKGKNPIGRLRQRATSVHLRRPKAGMSGGGGGSFEHSKGSGL